MSLTLVEAAKLHEGDVIRSSIIEIFARTSDILRVLPFDDIEGNSLSYNVEESLPGVAFRGVNESFSESTGILNPQVEALKIGGGDLDVDKFIVDTMGQDQRSVHEAMKIKAMSLYFSKLFLKGSNETEPREFDGLQNRIVGDQLIAAGATSGGDALSLAKLDKMIDQVDDPNYLMMSKAMRRLLTVAARTAAVGGNIEYVLDEFGKQVAMYNGLPILIADKDESNDAILGFTEANPGGGTAASTSIYCMSLGEGMLTGLENGMMDVRDLGELDAKPVFRTRIEWYVSIALFNGFSAARVHGIKDAAVVV